MADPRELTRDPSALPHAYFLSLRVANIRCFGPEQCLDLSDGKGNPSMWNILLGENGVGKTTLLQCLPSVNYGWPIRLEQHIRVLGFVSSIVARHRPAIGFLPSEEALPWPIVASLEADLWWGERSETVRHQYLTTGITFHHEPERNDSEYDIVWFGYSAARRSGRGTELEVSRQPLDSSLYDEERPLLDAERWLAQADHAARIDPSKGRYKERVEAALVQLLPDVSGFVYRTADGPSPVPIVEANTPYGPVRLKDLSLGYRAAMAWMVDFAARMIDRYPRSENPLAEPAVCLVDEIDLHLHPKWQRELVALLSQTFPKTQFVVTAHSPLVAQAAPEANVALLRRDGDHVVIENGWEKARDWRVDQILASDLFDTPVRSNAVRELLARRRELAQKRSRSAEEDAEFAELNERVDALPSGAAPEDDEARDLIRRAAALLKRG